MKPVVRGLSLALMWAGTVWAQVDESALPVSVERAFPNLRLRRPIVLTHAGDGSGRLFIASQQGVIQVLKNNQAATESDLQTFLDKESDVVYTDKENEEGLLGLAFHPQYKKNGEFFLYYTKKDAPPHTSVLSRFWVSKTDPNRADLQSEEELLRIPQPYWNHNGGGLAFGADGCLYISLGDGGSANDPHNNGQNLDTLLGKILRIDVDHKDAGKNYAIPQDNPFVGKPSHRPEIWAYGFRNVWGLTFDKTTGLLWAADVGQDLWEEIDLVVKGGNYGWKLREGKHKFQNGSDERPDLIEPIWEYHHSVGKSITGGYVYHGQRAPKLADAYLYADYVTGRVWALRYDPKSRRVTANHSLQSEMLPYIAFGEDEAGEVYLTDSFGRIFWFKETK